MPSSPGRTSVRGRTHGLDHGEESRDGSEGHVSVTKKIGIFARQTERDPDQRTDPAPRRGTGAGGAVRMATQDFPLMRPHFHELPLRVGTRGSPLALVQTRFFLHLLTTFCPVLRGMSVFEEHAIRTTGDRVQDRPLADIGGKGLFAKEIHEALTDGRIDFAVHSLKDLETELPPGIVLACTLKREDSRDALILGPGCGEPDPTAPFDCLPAGALIGTSSVRRQAQLLHARPDLTIASIRGNVQTRLDKVAFGECAASLLAMAGLRRLGRMSGHRRHHGPRERYRVARDADGDRRSGGEGRLQR